MSNLCADLWDPPVNQIPNPLQLVFSQHSSYLSSSSEDSLLHREMVRGNFENYQAVGISVVLTPSWKSNNQVLPDLEHLVLPSLTPACAILPCRVPTHQPAASYLFPQCAQPSWFGDFAMGVPITEISSPEICVCLAAGAWAWLLCSCHHPS